MEDFVMEIKLENMSWPEVEEVLKEPNAVILPVNSVEQHGRHLPLSVDFRCPTYMAEKAARRITDEHNIRVLVAPPIIYGETTVFREFPGTIGLSADTLIRVLEDIIRSFISHGFKNILIINGHYDNRIPIGAALYKLSNEFPKLGLFAVEWLALGAEVILKQRKSYGAHADELETSVSLVIQPENVHLDKAVKEYPVSSLSDKWWSIDPYSPKRIFHMSRRRFPKMGENAGVMGDPTMATKEFGEKVITTVVDELTELLMEIVKSEDTNP